MAGISNEILYGSNVDFTGGSPVTGQMIAAGQLLIGAASAPFLRAATLTAGTNVTIVNADGSITISASGGGGSGTITQVDGTANQITSNTAGTVVTLSLPATIITPGSLTTTSGLNSTTTLTAGTLFTASAGQVCHVTTPGAYPYTSLVTDYMILVDTSAARTIVPRGSPTTGETLIIKDSVGTGNLFNITITPSGKNIDGGASKVVNTAYGSVKIIYNGSEWSLV